jgi:hypothetical protein
MRGGDQKNLAKCWLKIVTGRDHFGDRSAWEGNIRVDLREMCVGVEWIWGSIGGAFVNTVIGLNLRAS